MTTVAYCLMSAGYRDDAVRQLVRTLHPAPVIIHHDFGRFPNARFDMPNGYLVPNPGTTGWGNWGFVSGIARAIDYALSEFDFDYLQMISPTCLPVRPLNEYEAHLEHCDADALIELICLDENRDALLEYAHRVFFPARSLRARGMSRVRTLAFGAGCAVDQTGGLAVSSTRHRVDATGNLLARVGHAAAAACRAGLLGSNPFSATFRPYMGSTWFCARRPVLREIVRAANDAALVRHFQHCQPIDECFFATVIGNTTHRVAPITHFVNTFDESGHPLILSPADLEAVSASGKFFARKFSDARDDPARVTTLTRLGHLSDRENTARQPAPIAPSRRGDRAVVQPPAAHTNAVGSDAPTHLSS